MKINKIRTFAFAISADSEKHITESVAKKSPGKFDLERAYTPLVFCNATGGGRNKGYYNRFFMSLTTGDLYFTKPKSYGDSIKSLILSGGGPEMLALTKTDLLTKLQQLPVELIREFGELMETGTTRLVGIDHQKMSFLHQLVSLGFAEAYIHQVTEYIKPAVRIPSFASTQFDLSGHFEMVSVVDEAYRRERIAYVPQHLCAILSVFYNCSVSIDSIVYLPYIKASYPSKGHTESEAQVTALPKNMKHGLRKYEKPKELKPIMLGIKGEGINATPLESAILDFSNVSGMDGVKEQIRQAIVYPLSHPELSKEFGQKAGGGILMYGPPGCGKTFIVRATVGEAGVNFFSVNVQDIIGGDPNVGAKKLHDVFEDARDSSPSIIFFDEIDALSGKREAAQNSFERMLINQFLTEMDGIASVNENVLVIGATNIPWGVDPALRRSGRFTNKIYIPPPDLEARKSILKSSLKGKPAETMDFDKLAELTEGYSSADISAISDAASKIPWDESLKGKPKRGVRMDDFSSVLNEKKSSLIPWFNLARKELENSGEIELYKDLSDYIFKRAGGVEAAVKQEINFSSVAGLEDVKENIRKKIVYPLIQPELAHEFDRTVGGGILLYGPPGCGKTYVARATAGECNAAFFNIKLTDVLSGDEAEMQKKLHDIFDRAARSAPSIVFFDEIDAIAGKRASESGSSKRLVNQLLTEMDGFERKKGVMIVGATNTPWDIDPALRRPGRFSDLIYIPQPDLGSREEIFRIQARNKPVDGSVSFAELAKLAENYSAADISAVCEEAAAFPWEESLKGGVKRKVSMQDFMQAIGKRKPSLVAWFKLAEKQIEASGEKDVYADLLVDLESFRKRELGVGGSKTGGSGTDEGKLADEKRLIEGEIGVLRKKHASGEISEDVFKHMLEEYERKLIELEVKSR